jgi:hypothetical protein
VKEVAYVPAEPNKVQALMIRIIRAIEEEDDGMLRIFK